MLMWIFQVLLHKLEESVSEQTQMNQRAPTEIESLISLEDKVYEEQPQTGLDETQIREFLSAKNLKNLRNDSSKKSSGCFGRRMDRIGSMSSLGCNTIGRYSKWCYKNTQSWKYYNTISKLLMLIVYAIQWYFVFYTFYFVFMQIQSERKRWSYKLYLGTTTPVQNIYFLFYYCLFMIIYLELGFFWLSSVF